MAENTESSDHLEAFLGQMQGAFMRGELSLGQAMDVVDTFTQTVKDKLPEAQWWQLKARLSEMVLKWQAGKEKEQPPAPAQANPEPVTSDGGEDYSPLWEAIKQHLPEHMRTKENARRIGFLVGLGGGTLGYKVLKTVGIVP